MGGRLRSLIGTLLFRITRNIAKKITGNIADKTTGWQPGEEELRQALARLEAQCQETERARSEARAILDAARDAMVLIAPDRQILSANRAFGELGFGGQSMAVVGHRFEEFPTETECIFADPAGFLGLIRDTVGDAEQELTQLVALQWPQPRELQISSTPVRSTGGDHLGRLYVFRDVTREREADRMKTEFVSLVSHELRTPLTSIKGYVDLLLDGEVGELAEEQREFLGIVKNNADRLIALINDLLDISRIEAGKIELKQTHLDLAQMIRDVADSFRSQIEAKQQQLTLDLATALPPVAGDASRVTQILANLISNAHKYTPMGGSIAVAAREEAGYVQVDVRDTGIGISPEDQAQLFHKFFRARNRKTQEVSGTGLGLIITRSLIQMHGGKIAVSSGPGQGSTFSFTLPALPATAGHAAPAVGARPGGRILVVDDEPDIANLIRRFLERAGYQVLAASTAAAALGVAQTERPDLITLDVILPDADGFSVLESLKTDPATAQIPVILLSILADNGRGKRLGAVDYITKPVQERALLERVGSILLSPRT